MELKFHLISFDKGTPICENQELLIFLVRIKYAHNETKNTAASKPGDTKVFYFFICLNYAEQ